MQFQIFAVAFCKKLLFSIVMYSMHKATWTGIHITHCFIWNCLHSAAHTRGNVHILAIQLYKWHEKWQGKWKLKTHLYYSWSIHVILDSIQLIKESNKRKKKSTCGHLIHTYVQMRTIFPLFSLPFPFKSFTLCRFSSSFINFIHRKWSLICQTQLFH